MDKTNEIEQNSTLSTQTTDIQDNNSMPTDSTILPNKTPDAQVNDGYNSMPTVDEYSTQPQVESLSETTSTDLDESPKEESFLQDSFTSEKSTSSKKRSSQKKNKGTRKMKKHFKTLKKQEKKRKNKTMKKIQQKVSTSLKMLNSVKSDLQKIKC